MNITLHLKSGEKLPSGFIFNEDNIYAIENLQHQDILLNIQCETPYKYILNDQTEQIKSTTFLLNINYNLKEINGYDDPTEITVNWEYPDPPVILVEGCLQHANGFYYLTKYNKLNNTEYEYPVYENSNGCYFAMEYFDENRKPLV